MNQKDVYMSLPGYCLTSLHFSSFALEETDSALLLLLLLLFFYLDRSKIHWFPDIKDNNNARQFA